MMDYQDFHVVRSNIEIKQNLTSLPLQGKNFDSSLSAQTNNYNTSASKKSYPIKFYWGTCLIAMPPRELTYEDNMEK